MEKNRLITEAGQAAKTEIENARAAFEAEVARLKEDLRVEAVPLSEKIEEKLLHRS